MYSAGPSEPHHVSGSPPDKRGTERPLYEASVVSGKVEPRGRFSEVLIPRTGVQALKGDANLQSSSNAASSDGCGPGQSWLRPPLSPRALLHGGFKKI
ncbi:hypothetical protein SKAU_G00310770 [Synaphobranchus kaupii]|uniref:Uncharacterized protein n=1 Tax=Synaphobranchus kaupii TaxID=118154 RepID=A0A9Q1ERL8_SYNKA|nr:hypothetical protein SKAU_G00310770 [Synaphobranchus kaupii]